MADDLDFDIDDKDEPRGGLNTQAIVIGVLTIGLVVSIFFAFSNLKTCISKKIQTLRATKVSTDYPVDYKPEWADKA